MPTARFTSPGFLSTMQLLCIVRLPILRLRDGTREWKLRVLAKEIPRSTRDLPGAGTNNKFQI